MSKPSTLALANRYSFSSCLRTIYGGYSLNRSKKTVTDRVRVPQTTDTTSHSSRRLRVLHSHGVSAAAARKTDSALCCAGGRFGQQLQATGLRASASGCANAKAGFCCALSPAQLCHALQ